MQYVIWNEEKVNDAGQGLDFKFDAKTYKGVLQVEEAVNASISSLIETNDIKTTIQSFYNETDIELLYELVEK
ncbi:hypothetical protein [Vibrio mediterranei]|uniref:hypothetical protein n=1 Tax=Vibrio mediterranei TaxID=689 RepID=UPI004067941B